MKSVKTQIPAVESGLEPRKIYKVTEDELILLEKGSNGSLYLNVAIAFLTSALSATLAYLQLDIESLAVSTLSALIGVMFSGYIMGGLLIFMWSRSESNAKEVLNKIRARINEEKLKEQQSIKATVE